MSDEWPKFDVRATDRRLPPKKVVRSSLRAVRFEPPRGTAVEFRGARLTDVDLSNARFYIFESTRGASFSRCDFRRVRVEDSGVLSGIWWQSVYRDCRFDGADLKAVDPENARFERCSFDHANLESWNGFSTEFIDCHFGGRLEEVKFWGGRPEGSLLAKLRRKRNNFSGNDFREAQLIDCEFLGGVELGAQLWPESGDYIRLDRIKERITNVRREVSRWLEDQARAQALAMLDLYEPSPGEPQRDLFARRDDIVDIPPHLRNRIWEMLGAALPVPTNGGGHWGHASSPDIHERGTG